MSLPHFWTVASAKRWSFPEWNQDHQGPLGVNPSAEPNCPARRGKLEICTMSPKGSSGFKQQKPEDLTYVASVVCNNEMEMKQQDPFRGEWVENPIPKSISQWGSYHAK